MSQFSFGGVVNTLFLSSDQCTRLCKDIWRLRSSWYERSEFGFWTLGTAAYLDALPDRQRYFSGAALTNKILFNNFRGLYVQLKAFLGNVLNAPCEYEQDYALPGFHIFQYNGADSMDASSLAQRAHFDRQFRLVMDESTVEETLSFTMLVESPSCGAFLAVWPLSYEDTILKTDSILRFAERTECKMLQYQIGHVCWHDGMILHALAPTGSDCCVGHRITVQGHGVRRNGEWMLYW